MLSEERVRELARQILEITRVAGGPTYDECKPLLRGILRTAAREATEAMRGEVERLRRNLRMWEEERHPTLVSSRAATAKRAAEIDRLEEVNAKHVLNRIEIEGQFKDLRTRAEQAERELAEARGALGWIESVLTEHEGVEDYKNPEKGITQAEALTDAIGRLAQTTYRQALAQPLRLVICGYNRIETKED